MKPKDIILALILVAATWAVYWPVKDHEFVNLDDHENITENRVVQKGLTGEGVIWAFTTSFRTYWHPLTWLSIMADVELFGSDPGRHHLSNVFLHTINALLLFFILLRMSGRMWQSFFVALLFALHPLHVESVAWATARKDVLSTFFLFLTIWAYHGYTKKKTVKRYLLVLMPYCLGLMSKPMLVTVPFILFLMDFWPLRRLHLQEPAPRKKRRCKRPVAEEKPGSPVVSLVLEKLPFLGLALICTLAVSFLRTGGGPFVGFDMRPLVVRMANALVSYVGYLWQTIWPMNLAVFYPYPVSLPVWQVAGAALLLALISVGALRFALRRPYFLVGWLWYLVTLFPVIGLVQWGVWPAMADRFTYVPLIGIFIMTAWGAGEITGRWKHKEVVLAATGGAAVLYFSVFTWFQLTHWQNSISLFTRALEVTDNNYIANNNLGAALKEIGKTDSAIHHYRESVRIAPDYWLAHRNLGNEMRIKGNLREAIVHYEEALRFRSDDALAHHNLGMALTLAGGFDEAIKHFREAIRLRPEFEEAHCNLGILNASLGKTKEAAANFSEALRINPGFLEAKKMLDLLERNAR